MEEAISLNLIKKYLSINIIKIKAQIKLNNATFIDVITIYGSMTLVFEIYAEDICGVKAIDLLKKRNQLIQQQQIHFPMIIQQKVITKNPTEIICLTLIQKCQILSKEDYIKGLSDTIFKAKIHRLDKVIRTGFILENNDYYIDENFGFDHFLVTQHQRHLCFDFTKIRAIALDASPEEKNALLIKNFEKTRQTIKQLTAYYYYSQAPRIKQIFFIHTRIYKFIPEKLLNSKDYFQLQFYLNIYPNQQVQIQFQPFVNQKQESQKGHEIVIPRKKLVLVQNLKQNSKIVHNEKIYDNLSFLEGRCLNCMEEVLFEQLAEKFISEEIKYYRLYRTNLVSVKAKILLPENNSKKYLVKQQKIKETNLIIYPTISKFQLVTFLIAYFKCLQPIIFAIVYDYRQNILKLQLQNKKGEIRVFNLLFYDDYNLKDDEITIIIEKARLRNCKVKIQFLRTTDAFLNFLANSEKLKKIHQLEMSDCAGLSENGINSLLISPFCKNLHTLSIISSSKFLDTSIETISLKSSITNLTLINCKKYLATLPEGAEHEYGRTPAIDLSKMHFQRLILRGVIVSLEKVLPNTLQILSLDQMISTEQMRSLMNLRLVELKIKLFEPIQKKSLFTSLVSKLENNLPKANPLKNFLQSNSKETLRKLDLSGSLIKYRTMKPLFSIKSLKQLIISNCSNLCLQVDPLPQHIMKLNISDNPALTLEHFTLITQSIKYLTELNISKTRIRKNELLGFLGNKKKKIQLENLVVSEDQYSNRMIEKSTLENVEAVEILINRLINSENDHIFNYMLHKVSKSSKTLRLTIDRKDQIQELIHKRMKSLNPNIQDEGIEDSMQKKELLIEKIRKFLLMESKSISKFKNLYIDEKNFTQIFFEQGPQELQEGETMDYNHLKVHTTHSTFNFSPRIKFPKPNHLINFIASPTETIDKITIKFLDLVRNYNVNNPINVSLENNKVIDKNIVGMLLRFGKQRVKRIDFRGCLFQFQEVIEEIFQFTWIEELNNSQYEIHLNKDNFITNSQKYLKFFMRVTPIIKLSIYVEQTEQIQILYSVLYHIIDQHSASIKYLTLHLSLIRINIDGEMFLQKLFEMPKLEQFDFQIKNCTVKDDRVYLIWQEGVNKYTNLKKLKLNLPSYEYPGIRLKNLEDICLEFSDQFIQENNLHKCIKFLPNSTQLKKLRINASSCQNIIHLNKIFGSGVGVGNGIGSSLLEKLKNLQQLSLCFQFCPLKQSAFFQFLGGFPKGQKLKQLELEISFTITNLNELFSAIQTISNKYNKSINMKITCVTQNSANFVFNRQEMSQNGIQFIL